MQGEEQENAAPKQAVPAAELPARTELHASLDTEVAGAGVPKAANLPSLHLHPSYAFPFASGPGIVGGLHWAISQAPAADQSVVTISDRRVRLPGPGTNTEDPTMYGLFRQWVQNDPDLVPMNQQEILTSVGVELPPLPPGETGRISPPLRPPEPGRSEDRASTSVEALKERHLVHWKALRNHMTQQAERDSHRYVARLQPLVTAMTGYRG